MSNAFEQYEETVKPVWRQRQERSAAKRTETIHSKRALDLEKEDRDEKILLRGFKAKERERDQALFDGPHGKEIRGLRTFLRTMTLSSAPALVGLVKRATWLKNLSHEDRVALLSMISRSIVSLRKRNGLTPFDDAIPFTDEPPTAFELIRDHIQ